MSVPTQASVPTQTFRFVVIASASPVFQCSSFMNAEELPIAELVVRSFRRSCGAVGTVGCLHF